MKRYLKWALIVLAILIGAWALSTLLKVVAVTQESKEDRKHLNDKVKLLEADNKQLSEGFNEVNRRCIKAKECTPVTTPRVIVENNDDPEIDQPEIDQPEPDDPEPNDADPDDPETQDPEVGDDETQDPEVDNPDPDDPEKQDDEIQDPEVDDPDPASPYNFTFIFTIQTPTGNQAYSVTCNSGTGDCVTTPK